MSLPLEGLLVADFSQVLAGPLAATMLADLGGHQRRRMDDPARYRGRPAGRVGSIADAFELAERLLEPHCARKGLGYDQIAAENPRIVYASITGFGSRGGKACPGMTSSSKRLEA